MARVLSVDLAVAYTQDVLASDPILSDLWVRGEVTSFSQSAAGHIYFNLSGEQSIIRCVYFKRQQFGKTEIPRIGDAVAVHGSVGIYAARGDFQLIVDQVLSDGLGLAQLEFERLVRKLESEGLFAAERKRPIPEFPQVIGVVTSSTGAVWHDVRTVIERRFPLVELVLSPSSVQGENAPAELRHALRRLIASERCDVIIIGRGGGSPEELAVFNDESLAREIFASPVPVISAVGHETDVSIADLVADCRAPTPSAAAELAVPNQLEIRRQIDDCLEAASNQMNVTIQSMTERFDFRLGRMRRASPKMQIRNAQQLLDSIVEGLKRTVVTVVHEKHQRAQIAAERSRLLNPARIIDRGYARVSAADDGAPITSAQSARATRTLTLGFADGEVAVEVTGDGLNDSRSE